MEKLLQTEEEQLCKLQKKARKDKTESERMDEVQRIKKRMLEINDKIEKLQQDK